jgi:L-seryl-tRNA(Ser) seleniumtransferase
VEDLGPLRQIPSVERVLQRLEQRGALASHPRPAAATSTREVLDETRRRLRQGLPAAVDTDALAEQVEQRLRERFGTTLRRVINATGVLIHTNLGRAPLSRSAQAAAAAIAGTYSTLEIDMESGERGSRHRHLERLLTSVTGAEAGIAVNNAAAGVLLCLAALSGGRGAVVARGELVEIGGGFRMPDVMRQSGSRLIEVGTTNRTYIEDFDAVTDPDVALLVKVHRSNFSLSGFTHDVPLEALVDAGRRRGVPVLYDLGSGCLVDLSAVSLPKEPTVQDAVAAGADVVVFSGDKLLGGPQAGLIVGRRDSIELCRRHSLARALRIDKLDMAALIETLRAYLDASTAWREIPILEMLGRSPAERRRRARGLGRRIAAAVGDRAHVSVVDSGGEVGGGSLPGVRIPTFAVTLRASQQVTSPGTVTNAWAAALRAGTPSVLTVVREGALWLDVLALMPGDDRDIVAAVGGAVRAQVL